MASFTFTCPGCGKDIETDDGWCGKEAACPHCSEKITVPSRPETYKVHCPYCAAKLEIQSDWFGMAVECPKCHKEVALSKEMVDAGVKAQPVVVSAPAPAQESAAASVEKKSSPKKKSRKLILLLVPVVIIIGILGGVYCYRHLAAEKALNASAVIEAKLVTNSNEEVIPFVELMLFKYDSTWDETIEEFNKKDQFKKADVPSNPSLERLLTKNAKEMAAAYAALAVAKKVSMDKMKTMIDTASFRGGRFTFTNVPVDKYVIVANAKWDNAKVLWAKVVEKEENKLLRVMLTNDESALIEQ